MRRGRGEGVLAVLAAVAMLGAQPAAALVFDLFDLTLEGPVTLLVGEEGIFVGRYSTRAGGFGMPFHTIDVFVDGALHDTVGTDPAGVYEAPVAWPDCGPRDVQTVAYDSFAPLREASAAVQVQVIAPPGAPQRVGAEAGPAAGQVTLRWDAPAEDGCSALTGYAVLRGPSASGTSGVARVDPSARSFLDTGLDLDTTYFYRLAAVNPAGQGDPSAAVQVTTPPPPEADALTLTLEGYDTIADGTTMEVHVRLGGALTFLGQAVPGGTVEGNVTLTVQEPCQGDVCTPEVTELTLDFAAATGAAGAWSALVGPFAFDDPSPDCLHPEAAAEAAYQAPDEVVRASAGDAPVLCA